MAPLKQIERSATVGFCPTVGRPLLAAGTVAGAIDMSFSTSAVLEIFSLDFASGDEAPVLAGSVVVPERFNRLAWGTAPSEASHMPVSTGFEAAPLRSGAYPAIWDRVQTLLHPFAARDDCWRPGRWQHLPVEPVGDRRRRQGGAAARQDAEALWPGAHALCVRTTHVCFAASVCDPMLGGGGAAISESCNPRDTPG